MYKPTVIWMAAASLWTFALSARAEDWIARSDAHSKAYLDVIVKYDPEQAASFGVEGHDEEISDLTPGYQKRRDDETRRVLAGFERARKSEKDEKLQQDLDILIDRTKRSLKTSELEQKLLVPFYSLAKLVFWGTQNLLDAQVSAARKPAIVARLRRYAGLEKGYRPVVELAQQETEKALRNPRLVTPFRGELEQYLKDAPTFVSGIEQLLKESKVEGWQEPYAELAKQLTSYNAWLEETLLPRARPNPQLPRALYEDALRNVGVEASPEALIQDALTGIASIRNEMQSLALEIAQKRGFPERDYPALIRRLKRDQIPGDQVLAYYQHVLSELEAVIRSQKLLTLPKRQAGIEIGSAAETAAQPAPHVRPPRLIGNQGERPIFVLPRLLKNADGSWPATDETYKAMAWTLTAHEARPGHELQFSAMIEAGVSTARGLFAFNSANVEGWGLYAEAIAKPFMPLEGQLISLQMRLLRATRMYLDPMINLGKMTTEEAKRVLLEQVVLGEAFAQNEVERYAFRSPGQATAYFYGFSRLMALRARVELSQGARFNASAFHDFILHQGLLPHTLLERAVLEGALPRAPTISATH
jgi:uncharacterized protein (DUF885 family)